MHFYDGIINRCLILGDYYALLGVRRVTLETLRDAQRVIGIKQVMKSVTKAKVDCVFVAEDADERVIAPLMELCQTNGIKVEMVPTMMELGKACSIEVGAAAAAILKQAG